MIFEEWRDIPELGGLYQCSNAGNFRKRNKDKRCEEWRYLSGTISSNGYVQMCIPNYHTQLAHRIIALTFIPNPDNYPVINHKDRIKTNNKIDNLEWVDQKANIQHSIKLGSYVNARGVIVLDTNDFKFYRSIKEASELTGIPYSTLEFKLRDGNEYKGLKHIYHKSKE